MLADLDKTRFVINFSEKTSNQFRKFGANLSKSNSNLIYMLTNRANLHALYKVASIDAVDSSFPFDVNPDGIVVFITEEPTRFLLRF